MSPLRLCVVAGSLALLMGCGAKKADTPTVDAAVAMTSVSVPTALVEMDAAMPVAQVLEPSDVPPPKGIPGVSDDPNTPPTHDDHDKAAAASIHKANYKGELDKLEKEDLNSEK